MSIEDGIRNFVEKNPKYNIYENYSGRGMFDRTCLGVVVSQQDSFMDFIIKLTKYLDDNGIEDVDFSLEGILRCLGLRHDCVFSKYRGVIVYD